MLAIACLIPIIAVAAWQVLPPGRDALTTVAVTRGNIENSVTALGTLQPRRYVDVGAQASGQIRKIHVEAGDHVIVVASPVHAAHHDDSTATPLVYHDGAYLALDR